MMRLQEQGESLGAFEQYIREVKQLPPLTTEQEAQLLLSIKSGINVQHAREQIVAGYQPLLIGLAKRFVRRCQHLELLDLVQEGNLGLLQAIEKFDESKGESTFRTFVFSWVRTVMLTAFWQHEGTFRFPLHKVRAMRRMGAVNTRLLSELGREPTLAETARAMDVSVREVCELMALQEQQVVSLQAFSYDDSDLSLEEMIADPASDNGEDRFAVIEEALESLTEPERVVIKLRFGFNNGQTYTQKEIAHLLGVTVSTVAALDRRAQKRLRQALCA